MGYSKARVNRSGRLLADEIDLAAQGQRSIGHKRSQLEEAIEVIEWWRSEHAKPLSQVAANLRFYSAQEGPPVVAQRLKKLPTIAGKLLRKPKMNLAPMADIGGVRAVVPDQASAFRIARRLRKNWTIVRFHDYVTHPKADGYRALRLINRHRGRLIEVQLRTSRQDRWANEVEALTRTVAPGLKFGGGPQPLHDYFLALGEFLAAQDQNKAVDPALDDRLQKSVVQALTFIRASNESR